MMQIAKRTRQEKRALLVVRKHDIITLHVSQQRNGHSKDNLVVFGINLSPRIFSKTSSPPRTVVLTYPVDIS